MEVLLPIFVALLGAILASFIGVMAERLNTGESWVRGRSHCNSCTRLLTAPDLVPIASWLATGGKCIKCKAKLPVTYVASEFLLASVFFLATLKLGVTPELFFFLVSVSILAFIVLYDLRHMIVPMLASGLFVLSALFFAYLTALGLQDFGHTLLVSGGIAIAFFLVYFLSKGRVMGLGDSPIALGLGILVGSVAAIPGLVFSFWIGALCGIAILVGKPAGHRMGIEVPFAPFLAAGFLLAYFSSWSPFAF